MPLDPEYERLARQRITAVFRFLQAFNAIRNPVIRHITEQPWVLNFRSLPSHPAVAIGQYEEPVAAQDEPHDVVGQAPTDVRLGFILKVRRPSLSPPPTPPPEFADWVDPGWDDPDGEVTIRGVHRTEAEARNVIEPFADEPVRPEKLKEWLSTRQEWAQKEKPARAALSVFERLYEIHTQMERESERFELVLGEGLLRWMTEGSLVHHPILLQRLQITFDPNVPEFTLSQTDDPIELYSALFRSLANVDAKALGDRIDELGDGVIHPLAGKATAEFLTRVAVSLHSRGEFIGDAEPAGEGPYPRIGRYPVVFMRARTLGFADAIEDILRDLERGTDLPVALMRLVGIDPQPLHDDAPETTDVLDTGNDDDEVLFTKPANLEQLRIARRLQRFDGVEVQGPPGTGKTHTIGNLIGHLLAQGKSILVTSHTTKALRMVRDQVAEEIRPLCVSVLDRDTAGQEQLQASVGTIVSKDTDDLTEIERRARVLGEKRKALVSQFRQAKRELLEVRGTEYIPVTVGGESRSPSDAARLVASGRAQNDWIPPPVTPNAVLPISVQELVELYATNSLLSATDERELESVLPPLEALITPVAFAEAVEELGRLRGTDLAYGRQFWSSVAGEPELALLRELATAIDRAIEPLTRQEQWRLSAIEAGQRGSVERIPWDKLLELIATAGEVAGAGREMIIRYNPSIQSDGDVSEIFTILGEIVGHFQKGRKLNWLTYTTHRTWKRVLAYVSVEGQPPTSAEEINAVLQLARLTQARRELLSRWERMAVPLGLPSEEDFGDQPEVILVQLSAQIKDALDWYPGIWLPLASQLKRLGFGLEEFLKRGQPSLRLHGDLIHLCEHFREEFPAVLAAQVNRSLNTVMEQRMARLEGSVAVLALSGHPSQALRQLVDTIRSREAVAYRNTYERIADLHGKRATLERRQLLLSRLRRVASAWAEAIRIRRSPHDVDILPGDQEAAWLWRQLDQELEILAQRSVEQSQDRVLKLSDELNQTTSELVAMRAWSAQVRRLTTAQRLALHGWILAQRRVGRGTGRRAPRWHAEARRQLRDAVSSVPVWIMPLTRVVENFKPGSAKFDVVVIDEASQSDLMGLIALYMGRKVVVVGDDQQVSPLAVGINQDQEEKLQDQFLGGVPNARLYNGQTSLYDLAAMCLGTTVRLVEHFRCVPEIISLSNYLSYQGEIRALRDNSSTSLKPPTVAFRVTGATSDDKQNEVEAIAVASLLVAASEQPEYDTNGKGEPTSFGVISLVGDDQARLIGELLRRHLSPMEYERRRILVGNSAHFQGDERDVVFLSVVDAPAGARLSLRQDGASGVFKKRFNVAASRARDQLWVVHSLDPVNDLQPGDLRRRLIEHAQDPTALMRLLEQAMKRVDPRSGDFEPQVLKRLVSRGYRVIPQWRASYYRIDFVVEGAGKQLAVECDGDRHHTLENLAEDVARQLVLERIGWRFVRIRGSHFFRDPDHAMAPVFAQLERMGIPPEATSVTDPSPGVQDELLERIIRRAQGLRLEWNQHSEPVPQTMPQSGFRSARGRRSNSRRQAPQQQAESISDASLHPLSEEKVPSKPPSSSVEGHFAKHLRPRLPGLENPEAVDMQADPVETFRSRGLEFVDFRGKGGSLWVIGGPELSPLMAELRSRGIKFTFARRGGRATVNRPAWFLPAGRT